MIKSRVFIIKAIDPSIPSYSIPGVFEELERGRARFGWSYLDNLDLRKIKSKIDQGDPLDENEKEAKRCMAFLSNISEEDYLIYPHQPSYGTFTIVKVTGEYAYSNSDDCLNGDFRSYRPCQIINPYPIDWRDTVVRSDLRIRLGKPGRISEIHDTEAFYQLLENREKIGTLDSGDNTHRRDRITESLSQTVLDLVRKEFSNHDLSRRLCSALFENMGFDPEVKEGSHERGCDILVPFSHPLIPGEYQVGIQVFGYTGLISVQEFKRKLTQLLDGWDYHNLNFGVLLTTGDCGPEIAEIVKGHNQKEKTKPVKLLSGKELTELFLTYFYT